MYGGCEVLATEAEGLIKAASEFYDRKVKIYEK